MIKVFYLSGWPRARCVSCSFQILVNKSQIYLLLYYYCCAQVANSINVFIVDEFVIVLFFTSSMITPEWPYYARSSSVYQSSDLILIIIMVNGSQIYLLLYYYCGTQVANSINVFIIIEFFIFQLFTSKSVTPDFHNKHFPIRLSSRAWVPHL